MNITENSEYDINNIFENNDIFDNLSENSFDSNSNNDS